MAETHELSFYMKKNAASVVLTMLDSGGTKTLLDGKNNFMHSHVVGTKFSLVPEC